MRARFAIGVVTEPPCSELASLQADKQMARISTKEPKYHFGPGGREIP